MTAPLSLLRMLRATALEHARSSHPDLAEMSRQLGRAIHRYGVPLERRLAGRTRRLRTATHWRLTPRRSRTGVFLCAWPGGHITPVHDHGESWGLEAVIHGAIEVQSYQRDTDGPLKTAARTWLGPADSLWFDHGDGCIHRCRNLSAEHVAWSLHVYGGPCPRSSVGHVSPPASAWSASRANNSLPSR